MHELESHNQKHASQPVQCLQCWHRKKPHPPRRALAREAGRCICHACTSTHNQASPPPETHLHSPETSHLPALQSPATTTNHGTLTASRAQGHDVPAAGALPPFIPSKSWGGCAFPSFPTLAATKPRDGLLAGCCGQPSRYDSPRRSQRCAAQPRSWPQPSAPPAGPAHATVPHPSTWVPTLPQRSQSCVPPPPKSPPSTSSLHPAPNPWCLARAAALLGLAQPVDLFRWRSGTERAAQGRYAPRKGGEGEPVSHQVLVAGGRELHGPELASVRGVADDGDGDEERAGNHRHRGRKAGRRPARGRRERSARVALHSAKRQTI
jgi:hypothetical protein